jgi:hypothetical protein
LLSFPHLPYATVNPAFSQNTRYPYPGIDRFPRGIFKTGTGLAWDRKKADAYLHKSCSNHALPFWREIATHFWVRCVLSLCWLQKRYAFLIVVHRYFSPPALRLFLHVIFV